MRKKEKKALVITGGYISFEKIIIDANDYDIIIAADSGYLSAEKLGITPHMIVGDFDSSVLPQTDDIEVIQVPAEKDVTDTMLACDYAIEFGAVSITIIGGTGGRADHFLSNVFSLEEFKECGVDAVLTDGDNTIQVLQNESAHIPKRDAYFSVFPLEDCRVTITGCKYPLNNSSLPRGNPSFGVSNEVTENYATISVRGKIILCESAK